MSVVRVSGDGDHGGGGGGGGDHGGVMGMVMMTV